MEDILLEKEYRRLIIRLQSAQKDYGEVKEMSEIITQKFEHAFRDHCVERYGKHSIDKVHEQISKTKKQNRSTGKSLADEPEEKEYVPDDVRKVFRDISKKVHPDKHSTKSNEEIKQYEEKFKEVKTAFDNGDWLRIAELAFEFEVELPDPTKEQLVWLRQQTVKVQTQVSGLENRIAWIWYHTPDGERANLMASYAEKIIKGGVL